MQKQMERKDREMNVSARCGAGLVLYSTHWEIFHRNRVVCAE